LIKSLNVSRKRRFPFLRTEIDISAELDLGKKFRELLTSACLIFSEEVPALAEVPLRELSGNILTNLRGRPSEESGEEILLSFSGLIEDDEEQKPFSILLITKFLDFKGRDIRHELRCKAPGHLEFESRSLSEIFAMAEIEPTALLLNADLFVPRVFTFLGNRIPELKESFSALILPKNTAEISIRDFDYSRERGLSPEIRRYLEAAQQLGREGLLVSAVNDSISAIFNSK